MEQVGWSGKLPVLSQHDKFWPAVESILSHARDCEILHQTGEGGEKPLDCASLHRSSSLLVDRARIRNATFRVSEYGAEDSADQDCRYTGRHKDEADHVSRRFTRTSLVTKCIDSGCQQLVDRPSTRLRGTILAIAGKKFSSGVKVDISFDLKHLQPHSTSMEGLWCGLHTALSVEPNKYKTVFFLAGLMHAENAEWDIVQALMAIATVPTKFRDAITPPTNMRFDLEYSVSSLPVIVEGVVKEHLYRFDRCPEGSLPPISGEPNHETSRRYARWRARSQEMVSGFVLELEKQWREGWTVSTPNGKEYDKYMAINNIMPKVHDALQLARATSMFDEYLDRLVAELGQMSLLPKDDLGDGATTVAVPPDPCKGEQHTAVLGYVPASALFTRPAPPTPRPRPVDFTYLCDQVSQTNGDNDPLTRLLTQLSQLCGQRPYQVSYVDELRRSSGTAAISRSQLNKASIELHAVLEEHLTSWQREADEIRSIIDEALRGQSISEAAAENAGLYPRISPVFLLQRLTRDHWGSLRTDWQIALVNYALSLVYLQRAARLFMASRRLDRQNDFLKELLNMGSHGCDDGDPMKFPESLLLELEQGILIRPVQQRIAATMRDPPARQNCTVQLNMGEGKSSVIVPIVSAALADGSRLVRVVVAKPQSKQMMHTLIATLGGLLNRRVFYLPISRAVRLTTGDLQVVQRLLDDCKNKGGVLLVQPEHLLSFKLMGLESIWADDTQSDSLGREILKTYRQFEDASRDIVDESDENFSVKFKLIYTMGSQQPIDMSPDRWVLIQDLMDVVLEVASRLTNGPEAETVKGLLFEGNKDSGRFPTIRVLEEAAGERLVADVAEQVCRNGLRGFPVQHQSKQMRRTVMQYILTPNPGAELIAAVESASSSGLFSESATRNALLLLRGLLAGGVIQFALAQKRFRVNYGLAPDRRPPTMLAVPYRAKDSPAPRSEFSHPDVVIVLTCLGFYYQGLSDGELRTCLEMVSKLDQAEQEYGRWSAASPQLPASLSHISSVNLKDNRICTQSVFPGLRYTKPAIDYYLANVVFPKEMREFPYKLSASGWDLGAVKPHPLTGFSGTTDSKYVLPLSVTALDLPEQRHTNSAVLACLLRGENTVLELSG